jgi:FixJ family two-component response regulator
MTDPTPTVCVVDDDPSVRRSLGRLLKAAGFGVETFASAEAFLDRPLPDGPACLVLDVSMPGLNGLDVQRALAERNAGLPVVFVTGHGDIPMTVRAMRAGATDFLPKPCKGADLVAAVQRAVAVHAESRQVRSHSADLRQRAEALTPREREVMWLVVTGMLNKQTGYRLGVTEKTVKVHRARVMHKMGADSLAELVRMSEQLLADSPPQDSTPQRPPGLIASAGCLGPG